MLASSMHPQVQLHPQASRNPQPHAPSQPPASSVNTPSPLATSPFFPALESLVPASSTSATAPSRSPVSSAGAPTPRAASRQNAATVAQKPAHGLVGLDATQYPRYSNASTVPEIRVLSAREYGELEDAHSRVELPEQELFPWSHGGADIAHTPATQYFGFPRGAAAMTPSYRGLTTIHAPPPPPPSPNAPRSLFRRGFTSSFSSWSSSSSSTTAASSSASSSRSPSPPAPVVPTCRLVSSFDASAILTTDAATGATSFALPGPETFANVNLRHFRLQACKYATVSDVVVYGENGIDESVVETATKVREAMDREFERRGGQGIRYNVFVISDPFAVFERSFPKLVAVDSHGFSRNRLDFFNREREEMRVLTEKSEIGPNVWLGNTQDVPTAKARSRPISSDSASSLLDDGNPCSFAICVEAHDGAALISTELLGSADQALGVLAQQGQVFDEVHQLLTPANEVVEQKQTILRPHVDDIVHLETLSTASAIGSSSRAQTAFIVQLVDFAMWLRDQASPNPLLHGDRVPRRVLLHCGDGYTETTLLALAYVMASRRISAPEAYLFLQLDAERSFFSYPGDRELVLKLERRVKDMLEREDGEERQARRWIAEQRAISTVGHAVADSSRAGEGEPTALNLAEFGVVVPAASSCGMERSDSGFVDSTAEAGEDTVALGKATMALEAETTRIEAELEHQLGPRPEMQLACPEKDAWFFGPTFEGHFPSRIMPHLYLGNVKHAENALMLKKLGITHVVSLGETALHPLRSPGALASFASAFRSPSPRDGPPTNSLWLEERLGNIAVLDMKNVADDGIDSIRPCIDEALDFITRAREQGGRVLVHCKVGVSRSASIVIASLMRDVGLDLASAYLVVRSRRLNILIQPNLPFMAALHAFEQSLLAEQEQHRAAVATHQRSSSTASDASSYPDYTVDSLEHLGHAGLKRSNRLSWSFLCAQVAHLNERFLCWCVAVV
ncbi:tyrosine/serine/threonine protein phosphatase pps1 [Rhodotorula kratochvilovae]